jgi:diacylglycerol O-acyltransferase-1
MWLLAFYAGFHLWLNILAELTRFSDRKFYEDWWNSKTMEEYWRLWNKPIHNWLVKHIYIPVKARTHSFALSMIIVFLVSAIAHEYLTGGTCHALSFFSFLAMAS